MFRLANDVRENVGAEEASIRYAFKPIPNILASSLYWRKLKDGNFHFSIMENAWLKTQYTWEESFKDFWDKRDLYHYLYGRWASY